MGLWVYGFADSSLTLVLQGHKHGFAWSADGEWIYYYDLGPPIRRIRTDGSGDEAVLTLTLIKVNDHPLLSVTPDARVLVYAAEVKSPSDIWLVEDFDPEAVR